MIPILTSRGRAILMLVVALLAIAIGGASALFVPAEILLAVLGWAYLRGVLRLRALERGALELRLALDVEGIHRGDEVTLMVDLENRSPHALARVRLTLATTPGLSLETQQAQVEHLWGGTQAQLRWMGVAAATGTWGIEGVEILTEDGLGMVVVGLHQRVELPFVVLPTRHGGVARLTMTRVRPTRAPSGGHPSPRTGEGQSFHQLRDFVAGDPLRRVDWRASARHGRVVVREHEQVHAIPSYVIVDVSTTMRSGAPVSKLEHGLSLARAYGEVVLARGDLLGWRHVSEGEPRTLGPGRGPKHERAWLELLATVNLVDDLACSELDREGLRDRIVNHLLIHDRLDFRDPPGGGSAMRYPLDGVNESLLARWVERQLGTNCDDLERCLLAFAQQRRIDVPYRSEARAGLKEHVLAEALSAILAKGPQEAMVVSDLGAILDPSPLVQAIQRRVALGHRTLVVVPHTPAYVDAGDWIDEPETAAAVFEAFSVAEHSRRAALISALRKSGATVVPVTPDQGVEVLLAWG